MSKESRYCCDVMKKHFSEEFVMTIEDNEDFKNSDKCWIFDNDYYDVDVKVGNHYHITGKYRGSMRRDCDINVKSNGKIPIVFHILTQF